MFFHQNENPSPLQPIEDERLESKHVRLFIKRDDLLHPFVSGNKFRKLKYNLLEMNRLGKKGLLTFGGAFSNHIHAIAAAGQLLGLPTVGIIRGELPFQGNALVVQNPTLEFAVRCGMSLHFVSRELYRDKALILKDLEKEYPDYYYLPEGGTNTFAMRGAAEMVAEITADLEARPDYICLACGTGGTTAGVIEGAYALDNPVNIIGFSALKGDFLTQEVTKLLIDAQNERATAGISLQHKYIEPSNNTEYWQIQNDYHFGGYAKWTMPLIDFMNNFKRKHDIVLDPIYTGKLLFGIFDLVEKGFFPKDTTIVAVHTGGLQGIEGFNTRFGNLLDV